MGRSPLIEATGIRICPLRGLREPPPAFPLSRSGDSPERAYIRLAFHLSVAGLLRPLMQGWSVNRQTAGVARA
jgi:hypothetical protein